MSALLQRQFERALRRLHRPAAFKLVSPGAHKFIRRRIARGMPSGRAVRAELFFGDAMEVILPEVVSEALYTYGLFDELVTDMMLYAVRPGDVVLDIGAHFGYFTKLLSHIVGDGGAVYAFEPTPSTYAVLERNVGNRRNITAFNLAAGRAAAQQDMLDFGLKYCAWNTLATEARMPALTQDGAARRVRIEIVELDAFLAGRGIVPDFIKIDAENFEADVVAGLKRTLQVKRPKVLMETGSAASMQAASFMASVGLHPHVADGVGAVRRWDGTLEAANAQYKDILFLP